MKKDSYTLFNMAFDQEFFSPFQKMHPLMATLLVVLESPQNIAMLFCFYTDCIYNNSICR